MKIATTYKEVLKDYPYIIEQLEKIKSRSRAKAAKEPLEKYEFSYEVCERITCCSFGDLISGKAQEDRIKKAEMILQERLDDSLSRLGISVSASFSRACFRSDGIRFDNSISRPKVIVDCYRKQHEENIKEEERAASLTPEEREAETEELLKQLRGPGFMELRIPRR